MTASGVIRWLLVLVLVGQSLLVAASGETGADPDLFEQLIGESGLQLTLPPGFTDTRPEANAVLHYERALRHVSGGLEIRYVIRPLGRISIDYEDPHNAAPEPNHLFPLLFESVITQLSAGGNTPNTEYPQSQARELFNADWAAAAVFDVNPAFSDTFSQAVLVAIHRDNRADAYTVFLYNEYSQAKEIIQGSLAGLSFKP